jgi:DNA-binding winged helix-turn-helix (wHTH) protein
MSVEHGCVYEFGPFLLDGVERCLYRDGEFIQLASAVFDILLLLVSNRGRVVTKEEIMSTIWAGSFVEENNLTVRMSALRRALCRDANGRQYVETVHGQGYRFVARVREVSAADERPYDADRRDGRRAGEGAAAPPDAALAGRPSSFHPTSIAVLPFSEDVAGPNLGRLADRITTSVIDGLYQMPGLRVLAHGAVTSCEGREATPQEVGNALSVRAVLVGRVLRLGERLIVGVELIDSRDGSQIWGGLSHGLAEDPEDVSGEIARDITAKLRPQLTSGKAAYAAA